MKKPKIFISSSTFAKSNREPLEILQATGWDVFFTESVRPLRPEEIAEWAKDADALLISTQNFHQIIDRFPRLRLISRTGIGLDNLPLKRCKQLGIRVHYTPDAVSNAVAEMVIGVMIYQSRYFREADRDIRNQKWERRIGRSFSDSVIGIIGFGRIAKQLLRHLESFHPQKILVRDIRDIDSELEDWKNRTGLHLKKATLDDLIQQSHWITLHLPKTKNTLNLISAPQLEKMKKDAFLINFSRGGILNEQDLHKALSKNRIQGAALDVFEEEPYFGPLTTLPNVLLTAHMGSCSTEARYHMDMQAAEAIIRFFKGESLRTEVDYEAEWQD